MVHGVEGFSFNAVTLAVLASMVLAPLLWRIKIQKDTIQDLKEQKCPHGVIRSRCDALDFSSYCSVCTRYSVDLRDAPHNTTGAGFERIGARPREDKRGLENPPRF